MFQLTALQLTICRLARELPPKVTRRRPSLFTFVARWKHYTLSVTTEVPETDPRAAHALKFFVEQAITSLTVQNRYGPKNTLRATVCFLFVYYIPSQIAEVTPWYVLSGKLTRLKKVFASLPPRRQASFLGTGSTAEVNLGASTLDYIFTDPPFGSNIFYADLNLLTESWHRVFTNSGPEAVVDTFKKRRSSNVFIR